jgi:hypothetical protein
MSALILVKRIRCDWAGCTNETEVPASDHRQPDGWTDLRNPGLGIQDLCPEHSMRTVADLIAKNRPRP